MSFYRAVRIMALVVLVILVSLSGCGGGGGTNTEMSLSSAQFISSNDQLIGGPLAQGTRGDILIYNNFARFVIKASSSPEPFPLDGMLIDADIRRIPGEKGEDILGGLLFSPFPNHIVRVQQVIDQFPPISIADDGTLSGVAQVRVTGVDEYFPYPVSFASDDSISTVTDDLPLQYTINYYLPGDSPCLEILTEVRNVSDTDRVIYPSLIQFPGPGKVFAGGYGFADFRKISGALKEIVYLAREYGDITQGMYLGNLLPQPLAAGGIVDYSDGYFRFYPEDGAVTVPGNGSVGLVFSYCAVKGYSADLYGALVKRENEDNTLIEGYTCFTSGNDREVSDDNGSRSVCSTEDEADEFGVPSNEMVDDVDIFVYDKYGRIIAHTRTGDDSEVYYRAFQSMDQVNFYYEADMKGKYILHLPDTYYKIWAVRKDWDLPDVSFLVVSPQAGDTNVTGIEADHVDFIFSRPVTLDIFAKIIPATPTSARLILESDNLYPLSDSDVISRFGFDYGNPLTVQSEIHFIPLSGHLVLQLKKGKYKLIADKGFLYNRVVKEVDLQSNTIVLLKFVKVLDTGKYVAIDPFVDNFSFGIDYDENSRDLSIVGNDLEGSVLVDFNSPPVTGVSESDSLYGSYFVEKYGNFILFPILDRESLTREIFSSPGDLFSNRSFYSVVADPSAPQSYFYALGVSEDLSTGDFTPPEYSNDYDFIQIMPNEDPRFTLTHWFRMLQMAPSGRIDDFIFHPLIGGSYSANPVLSPPGYITTFLYSTQLTSTTLSTQRCINFSGLDEDVSTGLCNLVNGASVIGRDLYFSLAVTTSKGQKAVPGEVLSITSGEKVYLDLTIQSPTWSGFDTVYVFDGRQQYTPGSDPFDRAYKFTVNPAVFQVGYEEGMARYQWHGVIPYPFTIDENADTWVVVVVTGDNEVDNYPAVKPFAISNPVFIDSDITRGYNPPCPGQYCPGR